MGIRIRVRTKKRKKEKKREHLPDIGIKKYMQRNTKPCSQNDFPYTFEQLLEIILNDELADFKELLEEIHKGLVSSDNCL